MTTLPTNPDLDQALAEWTPRETDTTMTSYYAPRDPGVGGGRFATGLVRAVRQGRLRLGGTYSAIEIRRAACPGLRMTCNALWLQMDLAELRCPLVLRALPPQTNHRRRRRVDGYMRDGSARTRYRIEIR